MAPTKPTKPAHAGQLNWALDNVAAAWQTAGGAEKFATLATFAHVAPAAPVATGLATGPLARPGAKRRQ